MKMKMMLIAGVIVVMTGFAEACPENATATACNAVAAQAADDETTFSSKLSADHSLAFKLMDADQRLAVLAAAKSGEQTPDAVVADFMTEHNLAVVEGSLKAAEIK